MRLISTILFLFTLVNAFGRTIPVGKGKEFTSLRQAVKAAKSGDTILLHSGNYKEGNIIIDKSIHLTGLNNPVLDGEFKNEILTLTGKKYCDPRYSFCKCRLFFYERLCSFKDH